MLDDGALRVSALISRAFGEAEDWLGGIRAALAALLGFFDSEPIRAHVLLVEAVAAGSWARERRERHLASLTSMIEDRWGTPPEGHAHPLVTAGVMASLLGVLHTHLVTGRDEPLTALLGPLMGLVTAPYLKHDLVTREIARGDALAKELLEVRDSQPPGVTRVAIPGLLEDPRAHRARACVLYLAEHPRSSNRQIARAVGVTRHTYISTLLARLAGMGLLLKRAASPGGANAWSLSSHGLQVARALEDHQHDAR